MQNHAESCRISVLWQAHKNGLSDSTGKEFVQLLFRTAIEALGNDPDIQVVMSTGGKEDARRPRWLDLHRRFMPFIHIYTIQKRSIKKAIVIYSYTVIL